MLSTPDGSGGDASSGGTAAGGSDTDSTGGESNVGTGGAAFVAEASFDVVVDTGYNHFDVQFRGRGIFLMFGEERLVGDGVPMPVTAGLFRGPDVGGAFADAYYCAGEGSSVTDNGDNNYDFALRNITRLTSCGEQSGSNTLTMAVADNEGTLVSSIAALNQSDDVVNGSCFETDCEWYFFVPETRVWVDVETTGDMGSFLNPTLTESGLGEVAIIHRADDDAPMDLACASTGTAVYIPDGTSTLDVTDLSEFVTCPGTPIDNNSWNVSFD